MLKGLNSRPDKSLNQSLLKMAYSLVVLALSVVSFFMYPQHFSFLVIVTLCALVISIYFSIRTIYNGEEAITYGGFANELVKNSKTITRIDNAEGNPIIQNDLARDFFKNQNILKFLEEKTTSGILNKQELNSLKNLVEKLSEGKVILSLDLGRKTNSVLENSDWVEVYIKPIYLKKTDIFTKPFSVEKIKKETYILWNVTNITSKKNMEAVLQDELTSLHDSLDELPAGLIIYDNQNKIEYCNYYLSKMLNINRDNICDKKIDDIIIIPQDKVFNNNWNGKIVFKKNNQEPVSAYINQAKFRDDEKIKTRAIIFEEISEEHMQKQLNNALNKLKWSFEDAPSGIVIIDEDYNIVEKNNKAEEFLANKEILKQNILNYISNDDAEKFKNAIKNKQDFIDINLIVKNKEKSSIINIIEDIDIVSGLSSGKKIIYLTDYTKQKDLEMQYAQAQKMQAMGQLAGGVAHDFNNLLTAMIGFCDLLLQRHGVGDPSFADLMQIKQNANRAAALVRQLLAFSRKQPLKPELIDVTESFFELNHMMKRILGENVQLIFNHSENLGFVKVDPVQFSQVIINLAVNAKDAMNGKGNLTISTNTEIVKEPYKFGEDTINPGEFVVINVTDTGCGIDKDDISRIFEPFFSTKQNIVGSGTGLGLAMVYGIVRQTSGFIKVKSEIDVGTTFSIYLPRYDAKNDTAIDEAKNEITENTNKIKSVNMNKKLILGMNVSTADNRNENIEFNPTKYRIIFVEDEASVRAFAVRALGKKGYDVKGFDCAEAALEYLEKDDNFDMMITDMVMPGMSGIELAKIVKDKIKGIKIILASGYAEEIAKGELSENSFISFMAKPFSLGDLNQKVFEVISKDGEHEK